MTRAAGWGVVLLSLSACARPNSGMSPATSPRPTTESATPTAPVPTTGVQAPTGQAIPQPVSGDRSVLSFDRRVTRDSLADAALLMALGDTTALSRLPDLMLDVAPALELNVNAFLGQPRVQYWVDYFSSTAHDRFQIWLDRVPRYEDFVRGSFADNRLPGDLLYLALIESGFSPTAVSSASAVGMWQFMAATGRGYGLQVDAWVDERRDPVKSTTAAARHLRDLTDRFGSYYLAAAAYNAGAGKVGRGLTRLGVTTDAALPDDAPELTSGDAFFSLADTRLLMQETKDYVPKLIAATLIAKAPENYGFARGSAAERLSLDSVMVVGGTGLDLIARLADTTLDALRELNPHLLRLVAPPSAISYPVRLPAGTAGLVAERYEGVLPEDRLALTMYKVKAGETVASIAKATGTDAEEIRTVNKAARATKLASGTTLYLPKTSIPLSLLRDVGGTVSAGVSLAHVVKSGETLSGIARRYGVSVATLRTTNHLSTKNTIRIGQRLSIPRSGTAVAAASRATTTVTAKPAGLKSTATTAAVKTVLASSRTHVVKSGETISGIASQYGVNQARLISLNRLGSSRKIMVGQRLKIPA